MNSENKDKWTPEVGKTAWAFVTNEGVVESLDLMGIIYEKGGYFAVMDSDGYVFMRKDFSLFPTPEAALQSIKVYDLEGKEVVIPRARVDLPDHTHLLNGIDKCHECGGESGDAGKIAKLQYSADMSYNPNQDRREGGC